MYFSCCTFGDDRTYIYANEVLISPFVFSINMNGLIDNTSTKSIVVSLFNIVMIVFVICIIDIFETISTTIAMKNFIWLKPKENVKM